MLCSTNTCRPDVDLFGLEVPPNTLPLPPGKRKRIETPRGCAYPPGTGPAGKTCGDCRHLRALHYSKTYFKCALLERVWTCGPGTDIRKRSPACLKFESSE